jgi:hypothetical protein
MSEEREGFFEGCANEAKVIFRSGVEGAKIGYKAAEPFGLGPIGGALGFVAGVKHADKVISHRSAREFGERLAGSQREDD